MNAVDDEEEGDWGSLRNINKKSPRTLGYCTKTLGLICLVERPVLPLSD